MKKNDVKITISITFPFDKANDSGIIYSQKAINKAFQKLDTHRLPILFYNKNGDDRVLGVTNDDRALIYDSDNKECTIQISGQIIDGDMEFVVNQHHITADKNKRIDDFTIKSFGISNYIK